jgi:hypothetical protein
LPPERSPSLVDYPECDKRVKDLTEKIWGNEDIPNSLSVHEYGAGNIWWGLKLVKKYDETSTKNDSLNLYPDYRIIASLLNNSGIHADFSSSGKIRFTHKSLPDREIYFVSNKTASIVSDSCTFRDGTRNAELWNPVNGVIRTIDTYDSQNGTTVNIKFEPFQSYFMIFYHHKVSGNEKPESHETFPDKKIISMLEGSWNVTFDTIWGGPGEVLFDTLTDWTKRPEDGIKYYSGIATYKKSFDLTGNVSDDSRYFLDLGSLKNLGKVKLNGKDLGVLWTAPWQVEITGNLKMKDNDLEVQVANLWINRLIGDEAEPWDGIEDGKWPAWLMKGTPRESKRYTFTTHRYYKKDDLLTESGLTGPVTIKEISSNK